MCALGCTPCVVRAHMLPPMYAALLPSPPSPPPLHPTPTPALFLIPPPPTTPPSHPPTLAANRRPDQGGHHGRPARHRVGGEDGGRGGVGVVGWGDGLGWWVGGWGGTVGVVRAGGGGAGWRSTRATAPCVSYPGVERAHTPTACLCSLPALRPCRRPLTTRCCCCLPLTPNPPPLPPPPPPPPQATKAQHSVKEATQSVSGARAFRDFS